MADPPQTVRMLVELRLVPSGAHLIELRDAARRALPGVADEIVQDMLLVLDEAVANAIRYGSAAGQPVAVSIDCDGDWIDLAVVDQGPTPRLPSLPNEPPRRSPPGPRALAHPPARGPGHPGARGRRRAAHHAPPGPGARRRRRQLSICRNWPEPAHAWSGLADRLRAWPRTRQAPNPPVRSS